MNNIEKLKQMHEEMLKIVIVSSDPSHSSLLERITIVGEELRKLWPATPVEQEKLDFSYWEPELNQEYYTTGESKEGEIIAGSFLWKDSKWGKDRLKLGMVYRTRKHVEVILENRATMQELRKLAGDFNPDWNDDDMKWMIGYDFEVEKLQYWPLGTCCYGLAPYFPTEASAQQAADKVGAQRIRQLREFGI